MRSGGPSLRRPTLETLPTWLFGALVAAAGPLLLLHYGRSHWFFRDDWAFITESAGGEWLRYTHEPFSGAHWLAVPRAIYHGLWKLVGITTYLPYQLVLVVLHLGLAIAIHRVMRRSSVRPWLAFATAGVFVIAGPGASTTSWAFLMSIVGSMTFGYVHLILASHDGPWARRDTLGLSFGLLSLVFSGVGVTTTVAVVVAVLLRRGWRLALLHGAPLALVYGTWALLFDASTSGPGGHPPPGEVLDWVGTSAVGTFVAIGRWPAGAWLLTALLAVGSALLWSTRGDRRSGDLAERLAMPIGLTVGALFFAATTALGRARSGIELARSDRYMYLQAALVLPLLAVAAEAVARRWGRSVPALVLLLLLPVPFNLASGPRGPVARIFDETYMDERRYLLTTVVRMPFARDVPRHVQPAPEPVSYGVTIGFLLDAADSGDLTPSKMPLTPRMENEFRVRLGLDQGFTDAPSRGCRRYAEPVDLDPTVGDRVELGDTLVLITTREGERQTSRGVVFDPISNGSELTVRLPDLHLRLRPALGGDSFTLCGAPPPS